MSYSQAILTLFGTAMSLAYDFLTRDLAGFSPTIAAAMETLNYGLQAFSYALLVIFTLWNVVKTTTSFVELKKPEVLIKLLIRFILTKYVIGAAWALVNGISGSAALLSRPSSVSATSRLMAIGSICKPQTLAIMSLTISFKAL